jgi:hypothetical protein
MMGFATHAQGHCHAPGTGALGRRELGVSGGSRALLEVLARFSVGQVAGDCDVFPGRVRQWTTGQCKPNERQRVVLARRYGIPVAAWSLP